MKVQTRVEFCENKIALNFKLYTDSLDSGNEVAAKKYMTEYLNYTEMLEGLNK